MSIFRVHSLLRLAEHKFLVSLNLNGLILDLGGDQNADYQKLFNKDAKVYNVNFNIKTKPDLVHDLEITPIPLESDRFDHVLLVNVLEHIFGYKELLKESYRLTKKGGDVVVVIPFLFPIHPSPKDFNRFTNETLKRELENIGFVDVDIKFLGDGVFKTRYLLIDRLLPEAIRIFRYYTFRYLAYLSDWCLVLLAKILRKKYSSTDYVLGYGITARK